MSGLRTRSETTAVTTGLLVLSLLGLGSPSSATAGGFHGGAPDGLQQGLFGPGVETPAVGDTQHPQALNWTRLICPSGEFVVGFSIRQGGWLAQLGVQCATPSSTGGWASQPVSGGAAGGEYGSHAANLICPPGRWVSGIAGLTVRDGHIEGLIERLFLADPVVSCGAPGAAGLSTVRDPQFKPEKPSALDLAPAHYEESPVQYCPPGLYAAAVDAAVATANHPDIKGVRLICKSLPASGDGSGVGAPPVVVRPYPLPR